MGFNRAHLIVLTISVIKCKQLIIDVVMLYGIECNFVSKQWMDLIAQNKKIIAQSKEVISL